MSIAFPSHDSFVSGHRVFPRHGITSFSRHSIASFASFSRHIIASFSRMHRCILFIASGLIVWNPPCLELSLSHLCFLLCPVDGGVLKGQRDHGCLLGGGWPRVLLFAPSRIVLLPRFSLSCVVRLPLVPLLIVVNVYRVCHRLTSRGLSTFTSVCRRLASSRGPSTRIASRILAARPFSCVSFTLHAVLYFRFLGLSLVSREGRVRLHTLDVSYLITSFTFVSQLLFPVVPQR